MGERGVSTEVGVDGVGQGRRDHRRERRRRGGGEKGN